MQRLTYVTLLVGFLMLSAFAGMWWGMLRQGNQPVKAISSPSGSSMSATDRQASLP